MWQTGNLHREIPTTLRLLTERTMQSVVRMVICQVLL